MTQPPAYQQFGKYLLGELIAVGGMAELYRAKTVGAAGFEKELVIKRILPQYTVDEEFVRMFIDEARLAARLQHANIVQIFDFDRAESPDGESYYIAMELVEGKDLRHVLKEGVHRNLPLSIPHCLHIAVETLKGLHFAHSRTDPGGAPLGIVHRDVSPHNVLISYAGEVKISDFGIAKAAAHARQSKTVSGTVKGKLAYMSPEQLTGQALDRRSDIYSMGIVLYEMLSHSRLFMGNTEEETVELVRTAQVPPLRERNAKVPHELEEVVMRMLDFAPDARFSTAAAAARALSLSPLYSANEAMSLGEYLTSLFPPADAAARGAVEASRSDSVVIASDLRREADAVQQAIAAARNGNGNGNRNGGHSGDGSDGDDGGDGDGGGSDGGDGDGIGDGAGEDDLPGQATQVTTQNPFTAFAASGPREAAAPAGAGGGDEETASPAGELPPLGEQKTMILDNARAQPPAAAELPPLTEQKTVILDGALAAIAQTHDTKAPLGEQKTVIFADANEVAARPAAALPATAPAGLPLGEQKTMILSAAAPAQPAARPAGIKPIAEQKTVLFDPAAAPGPMPQPGAVAPIAEQKTVIFADAPVLPAATAAASDVARPGSANRTVALDAAPGVTTPLPAPSGGLRELLPLDVGRPRAWLRWVLGPSIMVVTAVVTFFIAGPLLSAIAGSDTTAQQAPGLARKSKITLYTDPRGATVTIDGVPWPQATPTQLEGEVGKTVEVECRLAGFKPKKIDLQFREDPQSLRLSLVPQLK